ncbi:EAL domain-containing protein [Thiorhodococcus mannitoliphagus]|uniref:EAL domain-containing protein n=1 Tax=Thiorhodococcus mannitoliphagus TaxID=329406 RepID=A0A6P1DUN8_9GAMM|nr:EAL domain-containing protein [Thiorhodococcus mannitoliphagus]NEX20406.1 EAL domain-containing protein [Thiorhodococcus mannitoliphagus]
MTELIYEDSEDLWRDEPDEGRCWKVLIADDDPDVHQTTALSLSDLKIAGRPLRMLHTSSAAETLAVLSNEPDVAVILLDVVMESPDAGLQIVRKIRDDLKLYLVRIVLRTDRSGQAPEIDAITHYDINDYKTKTELTRSSLVTTLTTAIRSYDQLQRLESGRVGLERIVSASNQMIAETGLKAFAEGVILRIADFLGVRPEGVVCACPDWRSAAVDYADYRILGAAGAYRRHLDRRLTDIEDARLSAALTRSLTMRTTLIEQDGLTLFFAGAQGGGFAAHLEWEFEPDQLDRDLLAVFCRTIGLCADNVSMVARLREVAFSDPLLQIPNRSAFLEALDQRLKTVDARDLALALLDIDQFAELNDLLGHHYGDSLLRALAERLHQSLPSTCLIARLSGDGFALLGRVSDISESTLRVLLSLPFPVEGTSHLPSVCVGIVRLDACEPSDANGLLKHAYHALKQAKQLGHGRFAHYSRQIAEQTRGRAALLRDLRHAFEAGRLTLAYQPIVDLAANKVAGIEALLRWRMDDGSMVAPGEFIPLAEHTGLMVPIGDWVLQSALADTAWLAASGFPGIRVSVNVSTVQFREADLCERVKSALRQSGLAPAQVELEITESGAMTSVDDALAKMHELRGQGVGLAIDDFGTGYSSLAYLERMPATRLKIDRSFINTLNDPQRPRIVEMMISLAGQLGMKVVAEGIENATQLACMRALGCDEVQGFWFARPAPLDDLLIWLKAHK